MSMYVTRKERLLARLTEMGADPKRSLGQNFLISDHVVERILFAVKAEPSSGIIEVGPGLGALTEDLVTFARERELSLTLLELDRKFVEYWTERGQTDGLPSRVIEGDALQLDWNKLELAPETTFVSNLPYQISSSLAIERSLQPGGINRMILMFQKEVAQRISARARTSEYGLLTVIVQTFWETATVCDASPKDFHPQPNVSSRVLVFRRRKQIPLLEKGATPEGFLRFVKAGFSHRRKLLTRNLHGQFFSNAGAKSPEFTELEALFVANGLSTTARAEELDPNTFVGLYLSVIEKGWV
jgi:16S rRNA (adenine1518-N6/adenine1519-N6)-dimethyltransferase